MSSVYVPAQVVLLFRRIVNVISTISLSTHYLRSSSTSSSSTPGKQDDPQRDDTIHRLIANPALYDPLRKPRYPIVLCHGLYGFDSRGPQSFPSLRMHYWANVLSILRDKLGAEVIVTAVPATGSVSSRAEALHSQLSHRALGRGVNFLAHSMGGLDCRHLISNVRPTDYTPLSLTTVSTPHRGSPFMDWCAENLGLGKKKEDGEKKEVTLERTTSAMAQSTPETSKLNLSALSSLPSSFTTLLLSILDSPAYSNLTTNYLQNTFNPSTPDDPKVKYFSVTSRVKSVSIWHPFWFPKMVVDEWEKEERERLRKVWESTPHAHPNSAEPPLFANSLEWGNDGLVTIQSAKWGEFLGVLEGCDHWESRGSRGIEFGVDLPGIPSIPSIPSIPIPSIPVPSIKLGSFSFTSFDERSKAGKVVESKVGADGDNGNRREAERARGGLGIGFGSSFGEWSFGTHFGGNQDLGRFLKLWWREEREAKEREAKERESERQSLEATQGHGHDHPELGNSEIESAFESGSQVSLSSKSMSTSSRGSPSSQAQARRKLDRERDDEVIKASTDKLSRVFEWFSASEEERQEMKGKENQKQRESNKTEKRSDPSVNPVLHYSSSSSSSSPSSSLASPSSVPSPNFPGQLNGSESSKETERERRESKERHDLATKADLERFYIALSRKLWDEGL